jgi:hypothetical protein
VAKSSSDKEGDNDNDDDNVEATPVKKAKARPAAKKRAKAATGNTSGKEDEPPKKTRTQAPAKKVPATKKVGLYTVCGHKLYQEHSRALRSQDAASKPKPKAATKKEKAVADEVLVPDVLCVTHPTCIPLAELKIMSDLSTLSSRKCSSPSSPTTPSI